MGYMEEAKVYFITGVTSGIGREFAVQLIKAGNLVYGIGRRKSSLESLKKELEEAGDRFLFSVCDVRESEKVQESIKICLKKFNKIDVLIANAGYSSRASFENFSFHEYKEQINVNTLAPIDILYRCYDELVKSKGQFVTISSVLAYGALDTYSAYSMSKVALSYFCEGVRNDLKKVGIDMTVIVPGYVNSDIRLRDNLGNFTSKLDRKNISLLEMDTNKAVSKMIRGIQKRKKLLRVGLSTYFLIALISSFSTLINKVLFRRT